MRPKKGYSYSSENNKLGDRQKKKSSCMLYLKSTWECYVPCYEESALNNTLILVGIFEINKVQKTTHRQFTLLDNTSLSY